MRVLLTGSSGRVGRALYAALGRAHEVVGLDRSPFSTTAVVAELDDETAVARALEGVDAVVHVAGLHAPHVGLHDEAAFERVNVAGTRRLASQARAAGVRRFVYTSTTALYGDAVRPGACRFVDEDTPPRPRTVYHRSKLAAEALLEAQADAAFAVRIVRMSRCFPEPADVMAVQRLHRGIDVRDVAAAHLAALGYDGAPFLRVIASGTTPFLAGDAALLARDAPAVLAQRAPALVAAFAARGWTLPTGIDRVYLGTRAAAVLGWQAVHGFDEVLAQLDRDSLEVLPPAPRWRDRTVE